MRFFHTFNNRNSRKYGNEYEFTKSFGEEIQKKIEIVKN